MEARWLVKFSALVLCRVLLMSVPILAALRQRTRTTVALGMAIGLLSACAPTHNWREVRHEQAPGALLMPCKPERAVRMSPILGEGTAPVALSMLSCRAGGQTFAWAVMPVPAGASPEAVVTAWRRAAWASLQQPVSAEGGVPPGWQALQATASTLPDRWAGPGLDHRGQPIRASIAWGRHEGWIHQAAVYGEAVPAEVLDTFWSNWSPQ